MEIPDYFKFRERRPLLGYTLKAAAWGPIYVAFGWGIINGLEGREFLGVTIIILVGVIWLFPAFLLDVIARKVLAPSARQILARDQRAPILFLRGFNEEAAKMPLGGHLYEESLTDIFARLGPAIAVGRPFSPLPALGAARVYLDDADWQRGVAYLLQQSQFVVLQVADSEGVAWEIEYVLRHVDPQRLLIYFPAVESVQERPFIERISRFSPELAQILARRVHVTFSINNRIRQSAFDQSRAVRRQKKWDYFRQHYAQLIKGKLPKSIGEAVFLYMDIAGNPQLAALPPDGGNQETSGSEAIERAILPLLRRLELRLQA